MRTGSLALWVVIGAAAIVAGGFVPNPYTHVEAPERVGLADRPYPTEWVLTFLGILSVQAVMLALVLRPATYRRKWGRSLLAALLFAPQAVFFALGTMHSPWEQYLHFVWVSLTTIGLAVLTVISSVAAWRAAR